MNTDTPRTDALERASYKNDVYSSLFQMRDFAWNLERELAAVTEQRDRAWQAARERQWRPIETAPKDTPILASDQFGVTSVVYWRDVSSSHLPRYAWSSYYDNEYMHHVEAFPTHWMPLPPNPPTEALQSLTLAAVKGGSDE
jgi:hypothetical protein